MNSKQLRAAKNRLRKNAEEINSVGKTSVCPDDMRMIAAYHESGHAIGAYLLAGEFGYAPEKIINKIIVNNEITGEDSAAVLTVTFSKQIWDYIRSAHNRVAAEVELSSDLGSPVDYDETHKRIVSEALTKARDDGVDVDAWLLAYATQSAMGPVSQETLMRGRGDNVFLECGGLADFADLLELYEAAGVSMEDLKKQIKEVVFRARKAIKEQDVYQTIENLASYLIEHGECSGETATAIIEQSLKRKEIILKILK